MTQDNNTTHQVTISFNSTGTGMPVAAKHKYFIACHTCGDQDSVSSKSAAWISARLNHKRGQTEITDLTARKSSDTSVKRDSIRRDSKHLPVQRFTILSTNETLGQAQWTLHAAGCKDLRKRLNTTYESYTYEADGADAAVDSWVDEELLEMGWLPEHVRVMPCASA